MTIVALLIGLLAAPALFCVISGLVRFPLKSRDKAVIAQKRWKYARMASRLLVMSWTAYGMVVWSYLPRYLSPQVCMGNAVDVYGAIHWMRDVPCFYWGDMDTAGFAILNRLRTYLPHVKSFLMDLKTLTDHKDLWSHEKDLKRATLPLLAPEEQEAYESILSNKLGDYVRLEQERIPWQRAWETIKSLI